MLNRSELTKIKHAPFVKTLRKAQLQIFQQLQELVAALDAARVEFSDDFYEIGLRDRAFDFPKFVIAFRELVDLKLAV